MRRLAVLALLATPLAACGDDDGSGNDEYGDVVEAQGTGGGEVMANEHRRAEPKRVAVR